jgi:FAD dependent oxidoreductase
MTAEIQPWAEYIGLFSSRVTFYSQQIRALNKVYSLERLGKLPYEGHVAIVGAGASGITTAMALALLRPRLKIHLFESRPVILYIQRGSSSRFLRPHIYDWPKSGAARNEAGLPFLDWSAGTAEDVAIKVGDEFMEFCKNDGNIELNLRHHVELTAPRGGNGFELMVNDLNIEKKRPRYYKWLFICAGFGLEKMLVSGVNESYWFKSILDSHLKGPVGSKPLFFVSGNGDGGLIDFAMAAFNGLKHHEIEDIILKRKYLNNIVRLLEDIETMAIEALEENRRSSAPNIQQNFNVLETFDLFDAYNAICPPTDLLDTIHNKLRHNVHIVFHTNRRHIFTLRSSILNRFIVYLILQAVKRDTSVRVIHNKELIGDPHKEKSIRIDGEDEIHPDYRFLRFGPDVDQVLSPFRALLPRDIVRDIEIPKLTRGAKLKFSRLATPAAKSNSAATRTRDGSAIVSTFKSRYFIYSLFSQRISGRRHSLGFPVGMIGSFSVTQHAGKLGISDGKVYYYFDNVDNEFLEFRGPWTSDNIVEIKTCVVNEDFGAEKSVIKWQQETLGPSQPDQPRFYHGFFEFMWSHAFGIFGKAASEGGRFYDLDRNDRMGAAYFEEVTAQTFQRVGKWLAVPNDTLREKIKLFIRKATY